VLENAMQSSRHTPLKIALLVACVGILATSEITAGTITVNNQGSKDRDYTIDYDIGMDHFTLTITIPKGGAVTVGGPNSGVPSAKNKEIMNPKVTTLLASLLSVIGDSAIAAAQTASILAGADGKSTAFSFFDFNIPNYHQLVANTDFTFGGLNGSGAPILLQVGTGTQITDSSGQLLPQFVFTGSTDNVGLLTNPVPEPSSVVLLCVGIAGVTLARSRGRR
jgi:hypothetical protein